MSDLITNKILLFISKHYCSIPTKQKPLCLCYSIIEELSKLGIIYGK